MGLKFYIILSSFLFGAYFLNAQESKDDIDKKAQSLFRKGEFIEATPLFLRLLSLEPRNPNYNYKYGTCLLYNADKKKEAFKYLNYSVQKNSEVEPEVYYYLGKAYHLTYRFNKAIENYEIYKQKAGTKTLDNLQVDRQIEMCRNGKNLLSDLTETIVLEKTKIDLKSFFRIYDLTDIGGNLIVTEEFQSKQDKKNNHTPLIHFPANSDYIYYSSYGTGSDNKDIFFRFRNSDGDWSKESPVLGDVNTLFNEDYPYMHPNGKYLYFSSEGHKSMGGYDVFRSILDPSTNTFGPPENMNISISSPDNDFLYIVDSLDKHAYFASQRESETSNVHVYKVRLERIPMQMIILKGNFISKVNPTQKKISITVNDLAGDLVGSFKSNTKGEYIIKLPKDGKYEFIVKIDKGEKEFREVIDIPSIVFLKPLKQTIFEIDIEGKNSIVFNNLFNEEIENYDEIISEVILDKSKMDVNKDLFNIDSLDRIQDQKSVFDEVGLAHFTNIEIQDLIRSKFKDLYSRQKSTDSLLQKSKYIVQNGNQSINQALKTADSLTKISKANPNDSKVERWNRISELEIEKAKSIQKEMLNAQVIISFLEKDYSDKESLLAESKTLNEEIKNIETDDTKALIEVLSKHPTFVSEELLERTKTNAYFEYLSVINDQLRLHNDLVARRDSLKIKEQSARTELNKLKKEYDAASSRDKEDLSFKLSNAEIKLESLINEINYTDEVIAEKNKIAEQKEILDQINRSPIQKNMISQHDLAEEFDKLKDELEKIDKNSNTEKNTEELPEKINKEKVSSNEVIENNLEKQASEVSNDEFNVANEINNEGSEKKNTKEIIAVDEDEKNIIIPTLFVLDPEYASDIAEIESKIEGSNANKNDLINRKSEAILKIQLAKKTLAEQKIKNPDDKTLDRTSLILTNLEEKLSTEITQLSAEIDAKKVVVAKTSETQELLINKENVIADNENNADQAIVEENKVENSSTTSIPTLADVDTTYTYDIALLESEINAGKKEKKDLIARKNSAITKIKTRKNQAKKLREVQTDKTEINQIIEKLTEIENTLISEVLILEKEIIDQNNIDSREVKLIAESSQNEQNSVESTNTKLLLEVDPKYIQEISEIESEVNKGNSNKNILIKRHYQAALKVHESKEKVVELALQDPENESLAIRVRDLENLENQLYKEIKTIEDEIDEQNELIIENKKNTLEENNQTNTEKETNSSLAENLEEKNNENNSDFTESKNEDPENKENETATENELTNETQNGQSYEENLTSPEEETNSALAENSEEINNENNLEFADPNNEENTNDSFKNNTALLMTIDPEYFKDIAIIEEGVENGTKSNKELIKRKYKVLISVGDVKSVTIAENEKSPSLTLKRKIESISQLENQIITEIEDLEKINFVASNQVKTNENLDDVQLITSISRSTVPNEIQSTLSNKDQLLVNELFNEKDQLEQQINENPALANNKKIQNRINKIDNTIATEISIALQNSLVTSYPELVKKSDQLMQESPDKITSLSTQQSLVKIEQLLQESSKKESPIEIYALFLKAHNEQEKALKLIESTKTQKQIDTFIDQVVKEQNLENIETKTVALTENEIMIEQNQINLKLVNLNEQINELNAMIPNANKKGINTIEFNVDQLNQIKNGLENKYDENSRALDEIENQRIADANKGISNEAVKNTLTYKQEVEIAQSKEYINQLKNNNRLTQAQFELRMMESQLKNHQRELNEIYHEIKTSKDFSDAEKESITSQLNKISKTKKEVERLRKNVQSKQEDVANSLPTATALRYKTENMIARDVAPLKAMPIKTSSMELVKTGLFIGEKIESDSVEVAPIEIIKEESDQMGGLIFRVQIGAFRKPVPDNTFNEFSPITGDQISSDWTKYVVGLFGNKETASEARDKIRKIGYSDAFVVAYCDGERIPVYRAVELARTGACISLINPDAELISTTNGNPKTITPARTAEIDEFAYNNTNGSAKADVVENKDGLFYTVQVGVYNTPTTSEQLNNISPLITKRLPTGLIRYSSGIFNSYEEALPKRKEAVEKGISDAYIVAYNKGVRITVAEANEILKSQGESILQTNRSETNTQSNVSENNLNVDVNEPRESFINDSNTKSILISEKKYNKYPVQELNRYNEYGELFYYNSKLKRIQSFLFDGKKIPSNFSEDFNKIGVYNYAYPIVDTTSPYRMNAIENAENSLIHLEVSIKNEDLNTDLMETILNAPVIKQMKTNKDQLVVNFYAINIENNQLTIDQLQAMLTKLGATEIRKTSKSF